jgi:DNA-binding transcriptional MerR regulator
MPYKEKAIEKKYFSISEVSSQLDLSPSLLRFWETEFETTIRPKKNKNGVRMYTVQDIEKITLVKTLVKDRGFTLQGARDYLKKQKKEEILNESAAKSDVAKTLQNLRNFLVSLRDSIQ